MSRLQGLLEDIAEAASLAELEMVMSEASDEDKTGAVLELYGQRKHDFTGEVVVEEAIESKKEDEVTDERKKYEELLVKFSELESMVVAQKKGGPRVDRRYVIVDPMPTWCKTPQVWGIMRMMLALGKREVTDAEVYEAVEKHAKDVLGIRGAVQTGWRVFRYYRPQLIAHKNIRQIN